MRYDLSDFEWSVIQPLLPNKPRGVKRVDDRRVLNGIFWVLRSGAPWRDLPERYGPRTTCYNRFNRCCTAQALAEWMNRSTCRPHKTSSAQARHQRLRGRHGAVHPLGQGLRSAAPVLLIRRQAH